MRTTGFPAMTLIVGNPGETDEDVMETIDLIYEMERRGLFAFLIPSIFTPLHDTRMAKEMGVTQTKQLTPLQWQLMMKCWKMNLRPGQYSWWGPMAWRVGSLWNVVVQAPGTEWPQFYLATINVFGCDLRKELAANGQDLSGETFKSEITKELLASLKPKDWQFLRADNGDMPVGYVPAAQPHAMCAEVGS